MRFGARRSKWMPAYLRFFPSLSVGNTQPPAAMGTRFKTANNPSTSINPSTFPTETGGRVGTVGAQFGWGTDVGATLAKAMSE